MADGIAVEIVGLLASPAHRYDGRPADGPRPVPAGDLRDEVEVRAGSGIVGDRYATRRDPSVTLQSIEALEAVAAELGVAVPSLDETRRNVLLRVSSMSMPSHAPTSPSTRDPARCSSRAPGPPTPAGG